MIKNKFKNLKSISSNTKGRLVKKVFNDVSKNYDLMNDIMSFGLHRVWKKLIFDFIKPHEDEVFMDLAGGSGDISKIIKLKFPKNKCILVDSNIKMINEAKIKLKKYDIDYVCAEAEFLPFRQDKFNNILLAFGLRNFSCIDKSLKEINRVLKKKGRFVCLEFSEINRRSLKRIFSSYSSIIPSLGLIFAKNFSAYSYLIESIKIFPNQMELTKKLKDAGFKNINCYDLLDGLASIHIGEKKD